MEYNYRIGLVVFLINVTIIICCTVGSYYRFHSAVNAQTKREADQHFLVLLCFLTFLVANSFALYTGYKAYILNPSLIRSDLIIYRLADRSAMLLVSIGLMLLGRSIKGVFKHEE